jgi:hypothetical protein
MNLKKFGNAFTSKFVETGPSSYEKRIYRAAASQRLRNPSLVCSFPLWYSLASDMSWPYWLCVSPSNYFPNVLPNSDSSLCVDWMRCPVAQFSVLPVLRAYQRVTNAICCRGVLSIRHFGYRRAMFSGHIQKYWFFLPRVRCLWVCSLSGVFVFETCRRMLPSSYYHNARHTVWWCEYGPAV